MDVDIRLPKYKALSNEDSLQIIVEVNRNESKVSEVAEKLFPGLTQVCSTKIAFYEKRIQDLTEQNQQYKNSLWVKASQYPIIGSAGVLVGTGISSAPLWFNPYFGGWIAFSMGIVVFGISLTNIFGNKVYQIKQADIQIKLNEMENGKNFLTVLIPFAQRISQFSVLWKDFQEHPQEAKVKSLFEQLKHVQDCYELAKKRDKKYQDVCSDITDIEHSITGNLPFLFLMENVCELLKEGAMVEAWDKLKSTPMNEMVKLSSKVQPWAYVDMENSVQAIDYVVFFETNAKVKKLVCCEALQNCFKKALTLYLNHQ